MLRTALVTTVCQQFVAACSDLRYSPLVRTRNDLRPGDILLLEDTPDNTTVKHKGIRFGQRLTSTKFWWKNKGQTRYVHALIWICDGSSRMPDVAEASGAGAVVRTHHRQRGTYRIYRCTDSDLAENAAGAAINWAGHGLINYAKGKAVQSVFRSDKMGTHGLQRAQTYGAQIASTTPPWGNDGAFCSEFVVAATRLQPSISVMDSMAMSSIAMQSTAVCVRYMIVSSEMRSLPDSATSTTKQGCRTTTAIPVDLLRVCDDGAGPATVLNPSDCCVNVGARVRQRSHSRTDDKSPFFCRSAYGFALPQALYKPAQGDTWRCGFPAQFFLHFC